MPKFLNTVKIPTTTNELVKTSGGTGALTTATAGTEYVAPGGALGTPSSGTLNACTVTDSGTGAVSRSLQARFGDVFNAKDYGASGANGAEETTYVQAAIDAASAAGGGVVFLPPGTYPVRNLVLKSKVHLIGSGVEATTLKQYDGSNADVVTSLNFGTLSGTSSQSGINSFSIRDLSIDGNKFNDSFQSTTVTRLVSIAGATTTVGSTTGFPTSGMFVVATSGGLSEVIAYTGTTSITFTGCVRAQVGTLSTTHATGNGSTTGDQVRPRSGVAAGVLNTTIAAGDAMPATIAVQSTLAANWGASGTLRIDREAFTYSSASGTSITLTARAQNGTTAADHAIGDVVLQAGVQDTVYGYGVRVYGFDYLLQNLRFRYCRQDGIYSEWSGQSGAVSPHAMETTLLNVKVHDSDGHGILWCGPHDSNWTDGYCYSNQLSGVRLSWPCSTTQVTNWHNYGTQIYAFDVSHTAMLTSCQGEGGINGQILVNTTQVQIANCNLFAPSPTANLKGLVLGTAAQSAISCRIDVRVYECRGGAIDLTYDGGNNTIAATVYQQSGGAGAYLVGAPSNNNTVLNLDATGLGTVLTGRYAATTRIKSTKNATTALEVQAANSAGTPLGIIGSDGALKSYFDDAGGLHTGSTSATVGSINLENNEWIAARNAANTADVKIVHVESAQNLIEYGTRQFYDTVAGGVENVVVTSAGSGGTNGTNLAVTFTGGGFTTAATALYDVVANAVTNLRVTNPGAGYTSNPTVGFPNVANATAVATTTAGVVEVRITAPGTGGTPGSYSLTFTGGGGSGATASYTIGASGRVTAIVVTNPGTGFTTVPSVSFPAGSVTGATATAYLSGAFNQRDRGASLSTIRDAANVAATQFVLHAEGWGSSSSTSNPYGLTAGLFEVNDRWDVVSANRGAMCALQAIVRPQIDRSSIPNDDAVGLIVRNEGTAKGTDGIYVGTSTGTPVNSNSRSDWNNAIQIETRATNAIGTKGYFTYGIELSTSTCTTAAMRLANASSINALNAAGSADVAIVQVDASDRIAFYTNKAYLDSNGNIGLAATAPSSQRGAFVQPSSKDLSAGFYIGIDAYIPVVTAGGNSAWGQRGYVQSSIVSPGNQSTSLIGIEGGVKNVATGTVGTAIALNAIVQNTSTGVISSGYGVYAGTAANSGGGTFTTMYGVYVDTQSAAGTNWAVYTNGATQSRFGGNLVMAGSSSGTTTIAATAAASGTLTLPAATDTLVGKATTDILTNKTLTAPVLTSASAPAAAIGTLFYDSTRQTVGAGIGLAATPANGWLPTVLYVATAVATSNSNATTSLIGTGVGSLTLPAGFFVAGKVIRLRSRGYITSAASASTLIFQVNLTSSVPTTVTVCNTNNGTALAPVASMAVAKLWEMECDITCLTTGSSGTVMAIGRVRMNAATATGFAAANVAEVMLASTATPATATINTTLTEAIEFKVIQATNTASTIVSNSFTVEALN